MSNPVLAALGRPFRLGIVGGAPPSMIGPVHRVASMMDQRFTLLAGMLSSRPERSRAEGPAIGLAEARCYGSVEELIANERARDDGIEALAITTPNDSHAPYLKLAMSAGLDVMIEKPLCNEFGEAKALRELAAASGCAVAVTHTYSGYPMVREMRARPLGGEIGAIRLVQVEYLAGGLATAVELGPDADKRWRLKPERSGPSLVLGDIGTHAHHLVSFVTARDLRSRAPPGMGCDRAWRPRVGCRECCRHARRDPSRWTASHRQFRHLSRSAIAVVNTTACWPRVIFTSAEP